MKKPVSGHGILQISINFEEVNCKKCPEYEHYQKYEGIKVLMLFQRCLQCLLPASPSLYQKRRESNNPCSLRWEM